MDRAAFGGDWDIQLYDQTVIRPLKSVSIEVKNSSGLRDGFQKDVGSEFYFVTFKVISGNQYMQVFS